MTFADRPIDEFLDSVASPAVAPSAGAVAAVSAASGTALCEMVCVHTVGKEGYADVEDDLRERAARLRSLRARLLELAEADARAVESLAGGTGAVAVEEEEPERRHLVEIPLETAEVCADVLRVAPGAIEEGTDTASEDGATGVLVVHATLGSSARLVRANLDGIEDAAFVAGVRERVRRLEADADDLLERALANA